MIRNFEKYAQWTEHHPPSWDYPHGGMGTTHKLWLHIFRDHVLILYKLEKYFISTKLYRYKNGLR